VQTNRPTRGCLHGLLIVAVLWLALVVVLVVVLD
jgi:hypothetical protein